jgi:DNA (cytosine-5)-methyltransferase 1
LKLKHIGLFEGIGGFSLAAKWMGWDTIAWCEIEPFCQKVLNYHFPNAKQHNDIKTTDFTIYRGKCGLLTGGFPCQPYSISGKRKGKEDNRHLWPEMHRAIREIQPRWIVAENVYGLINWSGGLVFHEVQTDLEASGYEVWPYVLPACAVGAPHRRDRVWIISRLISDSNSNGFQFAKEFEKRLENNGNNISLNEFNSFYGTGDASNTNIGGLERPKKGRRNSEYVEWDSKFRDASDTNSNIRCKGRLYEDKPEKTEGYISSCDARHFRKETWDNFPTQSPVCSRDDGLSNRLDGITFSRWRKESIKAYGNAIVPQVAYEIFKAINLFEKRKNPG